MSLKHYLIWMALGTVVAWGAFWGVVNYLDPESAGTFGLLFFYVSIFLSLAGTLTLFGFGWRYWRHPDEVLFRQVSISFRQGSLLGVLVVGVLFLQANQLATWWNLSLLVIFLTLLEFFWLSVRRLPPSNI